MTRANSSDENKSSDRYGPRFPLVKGKNRQQKGGFLPVKEKRQLRYPLTRWMTGCIEVQDEVPIHP